MKPVTIIGGGLAGLTLGILLRRHQVPVTIYEAHDYPRHRVCGEFISGRGKKLFLDLQLPHKALTATTAAFHVSNKKPFAIQIDGLCIPRFELDALLANEFQKLGGALHLNQRFDSGEPGVIHATGRRRASSSSGHLIGLKAHALDAKLTTDLELHFSKNRYVGICRVSQNRYNVCGLFYSETPLHNLQSTWRDLLSEKIPCLSNARWDAATFCSVAGITLDRHPPMTQFAIGDAAAMIPPLTGNGMSMAFESAHLALAPLLSFTENKINWSQALLNYRRAWQTAFTARLRWAHLSQRLSFNPTAQSLYTRLAQSFPRLSQFLAANTR